MGSRSMSFNLNKTGIIEEAVYESKQEPFEAQEAFIIFLRGLFSSGMKSNLYTFSLLYFRRNNYFFLLHFFICCYFLPSAV